MRPAKTLIDDLYRLSFAKATVSGWRANAPVRAALTNARRFIADERMSAFMADLANESFVKGVNKITPVHHRIADSLRVSARPPHAAIWIEYNLHAYQARSAEIRGINSTPPGEIPNREGWLIEQHPQVDTACILHVFSSTEFMHEDGFRLWTFPFAYAWTCDNAPLPWTPTLPQEKAFGVSPSSLLVGINGYDRPNINCVSSPLIRDPTGGKNMKIINAYATLLSEWAGVVRRVWALLATIDHLPLARSAPRRSAGGFLGGHRVRPFLDHQTITLVIPHRTDTKKLARKAIAIAHRKRHEVRGHWRDDHRHPPVEGCPHIWQPFNGDADTIVCDFCAGRQFYIHKHERGDATLGYIVHDYALKHEPKGELKI